MLTRQQVKDIKRLHQKKYRAKTQKYLVEGLRLVEAVVAGGAPIEQVIVTEEALQKPRVQALVQQARGRVTVIPSLQMKQLSEVETSQGILAVVGMQEVDEEQVLQMKRLLLLDSIQDPGNVGTLIRSAAWFGVDAVVASKGTVDFYNPKVVRATMGGLWAVRLVAVRDFPAFIDRLKYAGKLCYGADMEGVPVSQWQPAIEGALVVGNEAHGLSAEVRDKLDVRVFIPPCGRGAIPAVESLNVSVATGILLYAWCGGT